MAECGRAREGLDVDQLSRVAVDGMSAGLIPFRPYVLRVRVALVDVVAPVATPRVRARPRVRIPDCAARRALSISLASVGLFPMEPSASAIGARSLLFAAGMDAPMVPNERNVVQLSPSQIAAVRVRSVPLAASRGQLRFG